MGNFSKVFSVAVDANEFLILQESLLELSMQATTGDIGIFDGSSKRASWTKMTVDWVMHEGAEIFKVPDIAGFGATVFAVSEKTADILIESLDDSCEFLPISLKEETWFILNVVNQQDAIDEDLTVRRMRNGRPSRTRLFESLVFKKSSITTKGLFRVKGAGLATYCTNESGGFYDTAKNNGLLGLIDKEIKLSE